MFYFQGSFGGTYLMVVTGTTRLMSGGNGASGKGTMASGKEDGGMGGFRSTNRYDIKRRDLKKKRKRCSKNGSDLISPLDTLPVPPPYRFFVT